MVLVVGAVVIVMVVVLVLCACVVVAVVVAVVVVVVVVVGVVVVVAVVVVVLAAVVPVLVVVVAVAVVALGGRRAQALDADSPPLEIGREVPAIGTEDPGKKSFLPQEGVKDFSPHGSLLKILRILWRIQSWRKIMKKNLTLPLPNL